MRWAKHLLIITFIESFATICVEKGIFFYAEDVLEFSKGWSLGVALAFGAAYVAGAWSSHAVARRIGEKRLLIATVAGQLMVHVGLTLHAGAAAVFIGSALIGLLNGLKWPVIESYVTAGHGPTTVSRMLGRFNVTWASAVPVSVALAGTIIGAWPRGLFALAGAINLVALVMIAALGESPEHMADDHPERPPAERLARMRTFIRSASWLLLASYSMWMIMSALLPHVFRSLGYGIQYKSLLSAPLEVVRVATFAALGTTVAWHGRRWPILASIIILPVGFVLVVTGLSTPVVVLGQLLFGAAMGAVYTAHLYYATVVENASVGAGGQHEGLIGLGFFTGPAVGLIGIALAGAVGGKAAGALVGTAPLVLVCLIASLAALMKKPSANARGGL